MSLTVTLTIVIFIAVLFAFATWRARQPVDPLKIRLIKVNYHVVQIFCIVAFMYLVVHLAGLLGMPLGAQQGGRTF